MKIAVASGKGGTGKTMVSTSLAQSLVEETAVQFLDCDVEAPNAHLFLKPTIIETKPAILRIPEIDPETCTLCGRCVEVCQFHALAKVGAHILVFPQLCHGCGSCTLQCPAGAIQERAKQIGELQHGATASGIDFFSGTLTISEPMPTPVIRQLKHFAPAHSELTVLDSPPGASCAVVATLQNVDFVLLVTEPTPFGWHDLNQMLGILKEIGTPGGILINRDGIADDQIQGKIEKLSMPLMMKIPYQEQIAAGLARGKTLIEILPEYQHKFRALFRDIQQRVTTNDEEAS